MTSQLLPAATLSVVVPVRNRASIVCRTLNSIYSQTLRPLNLIIVDSASTDTTLEVITDWADTHRSPDFRIKVVSLDRPGAAVARNAGLEAVDTPFVLFFDSDDEMLPTHLQSLTRAIDEHPDANLFYFDVAVIDPDGWTSVKSRRHHDLKALQILHCPLSTACYVVSTEILRQAGGWNEQLHTWDDLELGLRLLLHSEIRPVRIEGAPTVWVHPEEESLTGTSMSAKVAYHALALDAIDKLTATVQSEKLSMIVHARRLIMASLYRREGNEEAALTILQPIEHRRLRISTAMKMGLIYTVNRFTGHGGSYLAMHWFAEKAPKC